MNALIAERIVELNKACKSKNIDLKEIISKEYRSEVIISDRGGIWIGSETEGEMFNISELEELYERVYPIASEMIKNTIR